MGGKREVKPGDYLMPVDQFVYENNFYPRVKDTTPEDMQVLSISDRMINAGHYRVVVLNAGSAKGVKTGHVFSVFHPGEVINDDVKFRKGSAAHGFSGKNGVVELPAEFVGQLMVFRSFENVSYALVIGGKHNIVNGGPREIQVGDLIRSADERL